MGVLATKAECHWIWFRGRVRFQALHTKRLLKYCQAKDALFFSTGCQVWERRRLPLGVALDPAPRFCYLTLTLLPRMCGIAHKAAPVPNNLW